MPRRRRSSPSSGIAGEFLRSHYFYGGMLSFIGLTLVMSIFQPGGTSFAKLVLGLVGAAVVCAGLLLAFPAIGRWIRRRRRAARLGPAAKVRGGGQNISPGREPIPAGLRFAVLHRDGFRCRYCGRGEPEGVKLHLDHLVPVAAGGRNEIDNLVVACLDCNLGKSAKEIVGPDHS